MPRSVKASCTVALGRRNRSRHANACCTNGRWQGVVSDADLAGYDAMAEALLAPDLAYHLLLAGLCGAPKVKTCGKS
jgi:hypothetical protein